MSKHNVKVCFAGCEDTGHTVPAINAGVKYILSSAYIPMMRMIKARSKVDLSRTIALYEYIRANSKLHILDSGLFSLMFGAGKKHAAQYKEQWLDVLIEFIHASQFKGVCVEADLQKIFSVEAAWKAREKLAQAVPNQVVNVFHLEDGRKGLDRMIEFASYIAFSVPELRVHKKTHLLAGLVDYAKNKKPGIRVHLLGCTQASLLREIRNADTCDSVSWISWELYGPKVYSPSNDYESIYRRKMKDPFGPRSKNMRALMGRILVSAMASKKRYEELCGSQE